VRGARAAWAFPLAGAVVGVVAGLAGKVALTLGLPPGVAAALALATLALATGALHEDGLADTADGLWGGADRARRLEIMKDSRIGTFGVLALMLVGLTRWSALAALFAGGHVLAPMIGAAVVSRVPMVVMMQAMPPARDRGLSAAQGAPGVPAVWAALGLGAALGLAALGGTVFPATLAVLAVCAALAAAARARIGGQTGDILGASQQLAEAAVLACAAAA
jgi:adenosylcobinamide-GDP ribazoletransferase